MPKIKVTMFEEPVEVAEDEIPVLEHQGVVDKTWRPAEPPLKKVASS